MTERLPLGFPAKPNRTLTCAIQLVAAAAVICVVFSASVWAGELTLIEPAAAATRAPFGHQLPELLRQFGIRLIPKARAAECAEEGETCTSTEQCCAGLECSGGPPAICATED
jgi:hypothetical protein